MTSHAPVRVHTGVSGHLNGASTTRRGRRSAQRVIFVLSILGVVSISLILATWQHVEALRYGYRMNQLVRERERLEALKRQLESERAYYRSPQVIEPLARRLGLIRPDPSQVIVVEKGTSSGVPSARQSKEEVPLVERSRDLSTAWGPRSVRRSSRETRPEMRERARPTRRTGSSAEVATGERSGDPPVRSHATEGETLRSERSPESESPREETRASEGETPKRRRPSKQGDP